MDKQDLKMNKEDLKKLAFGALNNNSKVNFSDANSALINAFKKYYNVTPETTVRDLRDVNFTVIDEIIDEVLPKRMEDVVGRWANVKSFGIDEEVKFIVKNTGRNHVMTAVVEGARGGIYESKRLDDKEFTIKCKTYTAGAYITLEEIILGKRTLAELLDLIVESLQQKLYGEVIKALRSIALNAPAVNSAAAAGVEDADLGKIIRVVSAYGDPVIVCFKAFADKITNRTDTVGTPNTPTQDLDEIRNNGYISVYHGTPVIVLPNYIMDDNTNATWAFSEKDAFILPAQGKPVYIAFKGEGYTQENVHAVGSEELNYHRIMGVGILTYSNIGIYTDTDIATAEADNWLY